MPDPEKDGRIPYFIEVCQRVSDHVRETTAVGLGHSGPWNIAMHLRGAEALLMDTVTDPKFVLNHDTANQVCTFRVMGGNAGDPIDPLVFALKHNE